MSALNSSQQLALAGLFASSVLRELAAKGRSPAFARLLKESPLLDTHQVPNVRSVFDNAFSILKKTQNRNEYVYKSAIAHKLFLGKHSLNTASMLTEFRVGKSKADAVVLNGTSTVYEIKSERDNLDRLKNQIDSYRTAFAKINIITSENHLRQVQNIIPSSVGILILSNRNQISTLRESTEDFHLINTNTICSSVHTHEAIKILSTLGIDVPEMPNTLIHSHIQKIFSNLSGIDVHNAMVKVLRETRTLLHLKDLLPNFPKSLQASLVSIQLRNSDMARLVKVMNTTTEDALDWG